MPAAKPVFKAVVRPFDQTNVNAPVPPVPAAVAEPVVPPLQRTLEEESNRSSYSSRLSNGY